MMNRPYKILYIVTQGELGGAQRYVYDLATHIADNPPQSPLKIRGEEKGGYGAVVAMGKEKTELGKVLTARGVKTFYLKYLTRNINPIKDVLAVFEIKKLIKQINPDIVHLNSSKAGVIGSVAGWLAGKNNIIFTAHGLAYNEPNSWIIRQLYYWTERLATVFRRRVICVSEFDREEAIKSKLGDPEKFITIHNGIEPFETLPRDEARAFLNSKFEIRNSKFIIGTIAHDYKTKDLPTLRQAFKLLQSSARGGPNLKLIIIGRGSQYAEIPEARKYLSAFDIYVSSSVKEGFPYNILEAASAGLPIVTTAVGGIPEIIDEDSGILVPPKNPQALAEAVRSLISRPELARALGQKAKKRASAFTLRQMLQKTVAVYQGFCS